MNFFTNIRDRIKEKTEEMMERKEFLTMVEDESKPIRRKAYLEQKKKDAIKEGIAIAKKENEKKMQRSLMQKKGPGDFGIEQSKEDKWKFLDDIGVVKENDKTITKSKESKK